MHGEYMYGNNGGENIEKYLRTVKYRHTRLPLSMKVKKIHDISTKGTVRQNKKKKILNESA